ncbi:family A G protein-coupled receptor-like protein [Corynespora cassiicola Philippines]|uniref:Family A G protein-coupled receptor-like protein n=1 Tax=Corynespora cassiicola Philippines TaxID=1448308 RepID=A0A2T2NXF3_CORCC|nr:family A G protein-coupled receptor-like protein [Corynespora cassiicola Philippines]
MIVDPMEVLKKTSSSASPIVPTSLPSVAPVPSVVPDTPTEQFVSDDGKKTLWVVFVIMVIASAGFAAMSWRVPVQKRLYHVITTLITIIAAISYFAMATGHGVSVHSVHIRHQHDHVPDTHETVLRQVFWARYVDWSLTTPLLLLDLSLLAGLNGAHILMAIVADVVMILTGLFAAFGSEGTPQKWGWYAIACIAYLVVIWHLAVNGRAQAQAKSQKVASFFMSIAGFTLLVWTAYPIVWGIADGSRNVSVDGEIIAYAVLDVLAKPIFGLWLLVTHANMPETNIDLGGFWTHGLTREGALRLGDDDGA